LAALLPKNNAAGTGAKKVMWMAESFRPEHVAAPEFLNQNTTEALSFFAVEVELWRIGDSPLAPKFDLVAKPNGWVKSGRAIANGRDEGVNKLLFDDSPEAGPEGGHAGRGHGKILGGGHRQNHPPTPHAGRKHWHGGRGGAWVLYRLAAE